MYWYNELTIAMNNKTAATAAMAAAKNVLTTTSIEEYCEGEFAEFADSLLVKKNEVRCADEAAIWGDTYELVLPEIYKANGCDIALVQRLLQHSSAETTQRYIGIEPQRIEKAIEGHATLLQSKSSVSPP